MRILVEDILIVNHRFLILKFVILRKVLDKQIVPIVFVHLIVLVDKLNSVFRFHPVEQSVDLLTLVVMLQVDLVEQILIELLVELDQILVVIIELVMLLCFYHLKHQTLLFEHLL